MCKSKWLVNSVLLVLMGGASVSAEMMPVYMLNPIVITAERQEKTDLETPSTTEIITEKDIKEKGILLYLMPWSIPWELQLFLMALAGRMAVGM